LDSRPEVGRQPQVDVRREAKAGGSTPITEKTASRFELRGDVLGESRFCPTSVAHEQVAAPFLASLASKPRPRIGWTPKTRRKPGETLAILVRVGCRAPETETT
jgi:hypothetical protein